MQYTYSVTLTASQYYRVAVRLNGEIVRVVTANTLINALTLAQRR